MERLDTIVQFPSSIYSCWPKILHVLALSSVEADLGEVPTTSEFPSLFLGLPYEEVGGLAL